MSNSFELLTGPVSEIQKKYELLSDIVSEYGGKIHGSKRQGSKDRFVRLAGIL